MRKLPLLVLRLKPPGLWAVAPKVRGFSLHQGAFLISCEFFNLHRLAAFPALPFLEHRMKGRGCLVRSQWLARVTWHPGRVNSGRSAAAQYYIS